MAVKKVKPTSPGRRFQVYSKYAEITNTTPEKSLLKVSKKYEKSWSDIFTLPKIKILAAGSPKAAAITREEIS